MGFLWEFVGFLVEFSENLWAFLWDSVCVCFVLEFVGLFVGVRELFGRNLWAFLREFVVLCWILWAL